MVKRVLAPAVRAARIRKLLDDIPGLSKNWGPAIVEAYVDLEAEMEAEEAEAAAKAAGRDETVIPVRSYTQRRGGEVVEVREHVRGKPWRNRGNPEFREAIATAEGSAEKRNDGYGERASSGALGRYQLFDILVDIGWRERKNGPWTAKAHGHGVATDQDFLDNPEAQEIAMDEALREMERQAAAAGLLRHVGRRIDGLRVPITVTAAGIVAAVHRQGVTGTRDYFAKIDAARGVSRAAGLDKVDTRVETRLRLFQSVPYAQQRAR